MNLLLLGVLGRMFQVLSGLLLMVIGVFARALGILGSLGRIDPAKILLN
jgi:hypothetical protein